MATLTQLRQSLDAVGQAYHVLPLQNGSVALITQRGARVLGLFPAPEAENLLWTNPALLAIDQLRGFLANGAWNLGGDRFWIAPELQYNVQDRFRFGETYTLPPAVDPGAYSMAVQGEIVTFRQHMALTAYNYASGTAQLEIERTIRPARNPLQDLRAAADLMAGVRYGGYEQAVRLAEIGQSGLQTEVWNLAQLPAGGHLFVGCTPHLDGVDYTGEVPAEAHTVRGNHIRIAITAQTRFKVGYKAASMTGRMAYFRAHPDGSASLLVRDFFNNPSAPYGEEPPEQPGHKGHSVHVYNDDGHLGNGGPSFGEMECNGQPIGGETGRSERHDTFSLWAYAGAPEAIRRILATLMGIVD